MMPGAKHPCEYMEVPIYDSTGREAVVVGYRQCRNMIKATAFEDRCHNHRDRPAVRGNAARQRMRAAFLRNRGLSIETAERELLSMLSYPTVKICLRWWFNQFGGTEAFEEMQ